MRIEHKFAFRTIWKFGIVHVLRLEEPEGSPGCGPLVRRFVRDRKDHKNPPATGLQWGKSTDRTPDPRQGVSNSRHWGAPTGGSQMSRVADA